MPAVTGTNGLPRRLAFYGKGGSGKSTVAANLSVALAERGLRVMQIGCDPKADSTLHLAGRRLPTVLDALRRKGERVTLEDIVFPGHRGVLCVECGGPTPGVGCAGRGIIAAFEKLAELGAEEVYRPDVIVYDVLGDVVCGGFALPLRAGYAREVYVVTSGEAMSLYAARNIARAVAQFRHLGYARLRGVVFNAKGIPEEARRLEEALPEIGAPVVAHLPRDPVVQRCEERGVTVMAGAPDSDLAQRFRRLAETVCAGG